MTGAAPGQAPDKADPAALVLRGKPPGVVRFRKGAVLAIAALGSTGLAGVSWYALRSSHPAASADAETRGDSRAAVPEAVVRLRRLSTGPSRA